MSRASARFRARRAWMLSESDISSLSLSQSTPAALSGYLRGTSWCGRGDLRAAVVREDCVQPLPGEGGHRSALFRGKNLQLVPHTPRQVKRDRHRPDAAGGGSGGREATARRFLQRG